MEAWAWALVGILIYACGSISLYLWQDHELSQTGGVGGSERGE